LYLAVILDLYSRRVIGWAISNRMKRDLAIRALDMAVAFRRPPKGCIHHMDRGSQYCSNEYQKRLTKHEFLVSPLTHVNMRCRAVHERKGELLRQFDGRDVLQIPKGRADMAQPVGNQTTGGRGDIPIHQ